MQLGYSILVSTSGFQSFGQSLQAPANAQTCLLAEAEISRSAWYPRMQVLVEFVLHGPSSAFSCPHTQRSGISPRTGRFNMCVERSSATQGGPAFSEWACCGVGSRLRAGSSRARAVVYNRRAGLLRTAGRERSVRGAVRWRPWGWGFVGAPCVACNGHFWFRFALRRTVRLASRGDVGPRGVRLSPVAAACYMQLKFHGQGLRRGKKPTVVATWSAHGAASRR